MSNTVLITGASTGIGQATSELFFERGWNVVATMRTPEKGDAAKRKDPRWLSARLDVTDAASVEKAIAEGIARFGRIDVLVNNAGYALAGTFESASEEQIKRQFETNVFGVMRCCKAILPHFRANKTGSLINVTSMGGRVTFPFYSLYHATKWAADGFSESLQFELRPLNIKVKIIEPGAIKTDFYDRSADFTHDRSLTAYNALVDKAKPKYHQAGMQGAPPSMVAGVIWKAATDGSWKLRYVAGMDAKSLLAVRAMIPNSAYQAMVRSQVFS